MAGRKRIPDKIKRLKGTFQPCREHGEIEMTLAAGVPAPPEWFDHTAKMIYQDTANELQSAKLLQKIGLPLIVMYCSYLATAYNIERQLQGKPRFFKGETGYKTHPLHKISLESFDAARKIAAEFGITLSSQARCASLVKNKQQDDDKDEKDFK